MDPLKELEGLDAGHVLALIKKIGGRKALDAILRGEKTVKIEDAVRALFDKRGRRIPPKGLIKAKVCDANREFRLYQPALKQEADYAKRLMKLLNAFVGVLPNEQYSALSKVTTAEFKAKTERLLALIQEKPQTTSNIFYGVWLSVVLPQLLTDDLGTVLEQYLEAANKSYAKTFADRKFNNYRKGELGGKVSIADGSRHDQLIKRMKQERVIGIFFPNPLQGYSIDASREQMSALPEGFVLSGLDTVIAVAMYPDILARDYRTPGLDLAALSWQSADFSLLFGAVVDGLVFGRTDSLAHARGSCSGGLLFLG